jgi:hydrogenase maturation protease
MTTDIVRRIADAVLYEGYLLWPYSKSALKNQQRFTFGGIYPPDWEDRSSLQVQALLEGDADTEVEVRVRFLHVVQRQVLELAPAPAPPRPVDELEVDGERWISWEEAVERELAPGLIRIPAGERLEEIPGGAIRRSWRELAGAVTLTREPVSRGLWRVTVRATNTIPWRGGTREQALRQTLCSTHAVLRARGGAWVSMTDPPEALRAETGACECSGAWPVLVGEQGDRATMLAAPIILPDYPEIAPESPGDLFDSGEIDQMLVLNILAMSERERRDMRDSDPRAREILERTEGLTVEQIRRLNGAVREFGLVRGR